MRSRLSKKAAWRFWFPQGENIPSLLKQVVNQISKCHRSSPSKTAILDLELRVTSNQAD